MSGRARIKIIILIAISAVVLLHLWHWMVHIDNNSVSLRFKRIVDTEAANLEREFTIQTEALRTIKSLFMGSESVSFDEFRKVANDILDLHDNIKALEWIEYVQDKDKEAFEQEMQSVFDGYQIKEVNENRETKRAGKRVKYLPIKYVTPLEGNEKVLGFDIASDTVRLETLEKALEINNIAISSTTKLVQDKTDKKGFVATLPVLKPVKDKNNKIVEKLQGFAVGVYFLENILASSNIRLRYPRIMVFLAEKNDLEHLDQIRASLNVDHKALVSVFEYIRPLNINGNTNFVLYAVPTEGFVRNYKGHFPELFTMVGVIFLFFIVFYISLRDKRDLIITTEVGNKTEELRKSELKWKFALEGARQGVWDWDHKKDAVLFSAQCQNILGLKTLAAIKKTKQYRKLIHPDDLKQHLENIKEHLDGKSTRFVSEYRVKNKKGDYIWVLDVGKIVEYDKTGEPERLIGTLTDITGRKEYELERERLLDELDRANKKLMEISLTDALTGIANRRHFNEVFEREWERSKRHARNIALIMIDIDFFKSYNDHYGHQKGDECLKKVALFIKQNITRPGDLVARYGGEEFSVIMPETDIKAARFVAEKCREAVEKAKIPHEYSNVAEVVTISLGVASVIPKDDESLYYLINCADEALYGAKSNGRNQIVLCKKTEYTAEDKD